MLTTDELRDVAHRTGTVEGVHSDEVFEDCRLQFAQVFLHALRLKLEGADGAPLLIELVGLGIVDRDVIKVDVYTSRTFDIRAGLLQLRERLQTQEVHLDESCRFDDVTIILRTVGLGTLEIRVVGR